MRTMFSKTISYCLVVCLCAFVFCGCNDEIPNLTNEQSDLIAEYAAGTLLKHESGHVNGLKNVSGIDYDVLNEVATPTPTPTPEPVMVDEPTDDALVDGVEGGGEHSVEISVVPLNEAFGLGAVALDYSSYEITDTFPENGDEIAFAMTSTEGNDLLILHFAISNSTDGDIACQTSLNGKKIRAIINDSEKIRGEITLLPNDLMNYSSTILAGSSDDAVLVFEIPSGTEINSLILRLVDGSDELNYQLI